jgi:hypothetical protein
VSRDRLLIQVIGLQRSGNHAIIDWISSLFRSSLHLNDLVHDYMVQPEKIAFLAGQADKDCIICSFEDSGNRLLEGTRLFDSVQMARPEDFPGRRLVTLYVLRDPYNCWASRAKAQDERGAADTVRSGRGLTSSPRVENFIADWRALAERCRRDPDALVSYNDWFRSEAYRREVCARLGGTYSEATLNDVPTVGGGSSFDGYVRPSYREILGNAGAYLRPGFFRRFARDPGGYIGRFFSPRPKGRALSVDSRWQYLLGHESAPALFGDETLRRLSEEIFGFSVDADGRTHRAAAPAAAPGRGLVAAAQDA